MILERRVAVIDEEERQILAGEIVLEMEALIPRILADALTNPRLQSTRDYCGTPGDKRFALVNSDAWPWPKSFHPKVKGFELTPANPAGKRLLGLRIDGRQWTSRDPDGKLAIRVTLVNAGGSDNGQALGGCTVTYFAHQGDKGWSIELSEP
jgi:hypothetical protein